MNFSGRRVLIIGATGAIGGRLAERLLLEEGAEVRALVRNMVTASWLARLPMEMVPGDITDSGAVLRAAEDCDAIVNCAHSSSSDFEICQLVNVEGVRNVMTAGLETGVRRIVHVSSTAVMGAAPPEGANEAFVCRPTGWVYADTKLEGERLALQYAQEKRAPVVVIRPAIVFGPRVVSWTIGPVLAIRKGRLVLINRGAGVCNSLYIDNLVDALLLALEVEKLTGEVFIVTDDEPVCWRDLLGAYGEWLGVSLPLMSSASARLTGVLMDAIEAVSTPTIERVFSEEEERIRQGGRDLLRVLLFAGKMRLTRSYVDLVTKCGRLDVSKARKHLGYKPRIRFEEAMSYTQSWLLQQGFLEDDARQR